MPIHLPEEFHKSPFTTAAAVTALVLSIFTLYDSKVTQHIAQRVESENALNDAFDLLGGHPGSTYLPGFGHKSEDLELAHRKIQSVLISDEKNGRAHNLEGDYLIIRRNFDEAIQELKRSIELNPDNIEAQIDLAYAHHCKHEFDQAMTSLKAIEPKYPNNAHLLFGLAITYFASNQTEMSVGYAKRAVVLESNNAEYEYVLASGLFDIGNESESFEHCQRAVQLNDNFGKAWLLLSLEDLGRKNWADARHAITRADSLRDQFAAEELDILNKVKNKLGTPTSQPT